MMQLFFLIDGASEVSIRHSRIEKNDRGAIIYRNTGEIGPNLLISNCMIRRNGYHLCGNITTTAHAVQLHFHNALVSKALSFLVTLSFYCYFSLSGFFFWFQLAHFRNNLLMENIGGLWMTALTTSAVARLAVVIRDCALMHNSNGTILAFLGNGNQVGFFFPFLHF